MTTLGEEGDLGSLLQAPPLSPDPARGSSAPRLSGSALCSSQVDLKDLSFLSLQASASHALASVDEVPMLRGLQVPICPNHSPDTLNPDSFAHAVPFELGHPLLLLQAAPGS